MIEIILWIILVGCGAIVGFAYLVEIINWWVSRPTPKHKAEWAEHKRYMASIVPNPKEYVAKTKGGGKCI